MQAPRIARRVGRATGIAAGTVAIALWILFMRRVVMAGAGSGWVAGAMIGVALVALFASLVERPALLAACFVLSFMPVGLYLLATASVFAGIGLANLLYLAAALLLWLSRRGNPADGGAA